MTRIFVGWCHVAHLLFPFNLPFSLLPSPSPSFLSRKGSTPAIFWIPWKTTPCVPNVENKNDGLSGLAKLVDARTPPPQTPCQQTNYVRKTIDSKAQTQCV